MPGMDLFFVALMAAWFLVEGKVKQAFAKDPDAEARKHAERMKAAGEKAKERDGMAPGDDPDAGRVKRSIARRLADMIKRYGDAVKEAAKDYEDGEGGFAGAWKRAKERAAAWAADRAWGAQTIVCGPALGPATGGGGAGPTGKRKPDPKPRPSIHVESERLDEDVPEAVWPPLEIPYVPPAQLPPSSSTGDDPVVVPPPAAIPPPAAAPYVPPTQLPPGPRGGDGAQTAPGTGGKPLSPSELLERLRRSWDIVVPPEPPEPPASPAGENVQAKAERMDQAPVGANARGLPPGSATTPQGAITDGSTEGMTSPAVRGHAPAIRGMGQNVKPVGGTELAEALCQTFIDTRNEINVALAISRTVYDLADWRIKEVEAMLPLIGALVAKAQQMAGRYTDDKVVVAAADVTGAGTDGGYLKKD